MSSFFVFQVDPDSLLEETMDKIRQIELRNRERMAQAKIRMSQLSTASNASSSSDEQEEESDEHDDDDDVVHDEYLSLGRYEYKRLALTGYKKPIMKPPSPTTGAVDFLTEEWPITHEMLVEALKQK